MISDKYLCEFFGLDDSPKNRKELCYIKAGLVRVQFENGQDICRIGEEADGMYFLEQGMAEVLNGEGEQVNIMHEGEYFGEYAVLSGGRRLSTVRSVGRTVCYLMKPKDVMRTLSKHPDIYGELMKRVYGQVSRKHSQLLELSSKRRGILQTPGNRVPMTRTRIIITYVCTAIIFLLSYLLIPEGATGPVFLLPLGFMLAYVLWSRRTVETLVVSCFLAALLCFGSGITTGFTDGLSETIGSPDNVNTVLVMTLMGGMISLIEASGAVTAFKKMCDRKITKPSSAMLASVSIMAVSSIDDCLNFTCGATATGKAADRARVPKERSGLLFSILPTVLSSFVPLSLWSIFVMGSYSSEAGDNVFGLFCRSVPYNFYSIIGLMAMLLLCIGRLPRIRSLKKADGRVQSGGDLWPEGSERYLKTEDGEAWGRPANLVLPVVVLAVSSLTVRSITGAGFAVDSACGLVATLVFMFFLYCLQGLMNPEKYMEHLIRGISGAILPCILYLLATFFSNMLSTLGMSEFFSEIVGRFDDSKRFLPAVIFLASLLVTVALGSSWSMYAISFPIAVSLCLNAGISLPLVLGAVAAAGIAGEQICPFTGSELDVADAIGCNPKVIMKNRIIYASIFAAIAFIGYIAAGMIM